MRVFYVIYVPEGETRLRSVLDTIRLLAAPTVAHSAHITVRGPYAQRRNLAALSETIEGQSVRLQGVGYFFHRGQHTVYLEASGPAIAEAWDKPDYEFNPHVTIYDGKSRRDAIRLYQVMTRFPISVAFAADGLEPLISNGGQSDLAVLQGIDFNFIGSVLGAEFDPAAVFALTHERRIGIIERLCRYLAHASDPPSESGSSNERIGLRPGWSWQRQRRFGSREAVADPHSAATLTGRLATVADPVTEAWRTWSFLSHTYRDHLETQQ